MLEVDDTAVSPHLTSVLFDAARSAGEQLSMFLERDVRLQGTAARRVRLEQVTGLLDGEDRLITAVYLAFSGDVDGHVMLAFAPEMAAQMAAALLMEDPPDGYALSPMQASALGEVGNITTSAFLNAVAGAYGMCIYPSPPAVAQDMVGALLDGIILDLAMQSTYALMLHTTFEVAGDRLQGALVLLPSATSYERLEGLLEQCR